MSSKVAVLAAVALAGAPAAARADDAPAEAIALFDQGVKDLQAGKIEVACKELAASLAQFQDSGTKGALATCYSQLGKVVSAWKLWRDLADTAPTPDMKRDAAGNAYQLEPRLPHFVVRLRGPAVAGLKVTVGGGDIADPTLAAPLPIDPGPFTALATAPDHIEWMATFTAAEGQITSVEIPLLAARPKPALTAVAAAGPQTLIVRENTMATRRSRHVIGLSIGIFGVAALALGGGFGASAISHWQTAERLCGNMITNCPTSQSTAAESNVTSARTSALVSTVGFSVGGIAAAVGAIVFLSAPSAEQGNLTGWRVTPSVSPAATGVTLLRAW